MIAPMPLSLSALMSRLSPTQSLICGYCNLIDTRHGRSLFTGTSNAMTLATSLLLTPIRREYVVRSSRPKFVEREPSLPSR
jgi:hypothetical protein